MGSSPGLHQGRVGTVPGGGGGGGGQPGLERRTQEDGLHHLHTWLDHHQDGQTRGKLLENVEVIKNLFGILKYFYETK